MTTKSACYSSDVHPPAAYLNPDFLRSDDARALRILSEYLEPLARFRDHNIQDTVVFFGSARVHSRARAQRSVLQLGPRRKNDAEHARRLRSANKALAWSRYYEEARTLAGLLTEWALTLDEPRHRFVVCSGGGNGIMEAANRGAREAGGKTIGLNIRLPQEQRLNRYISPGLGFEFHYFFMRKFWFAYLAKALVIFPGGYGTLDELFEILTLSQTRKLGKRVDVVLYGRDYWDRVFDLKPLSQWGAISSGDLDLLHHCDNPEDAFEHLRAHLVKYHLVPPSAQEDRAPGLAVTQG
jgi:uncharacterized protein (TIGR00730 family)